MAKKSSVHASSIVLEPLVSPIKNHLLAALAPEVQARVFPQLELVTFSRGKVLYGQGDYQEYVYFPIDGIVALLHVLEGGATAEFSMVGNEGIIGIASLTGGDSTSSRAEVQSFCRAYRITGKQLKDEFDRNSDLMRLLLRYFQSLITQMAQTAVCNRHHSIDQQLCRWLLLSTDRVQSNYLDMTQESIATMLGVRREGVTEAAGRLQALRVIQYHRGHIEVLDRGLLEQLSCECYSVVRRETDRLFRLN